VKEGITSICINLDNPIYIRITGFFQYSSD